ncbi:SEC59/DGK1/VTE5 family protein [Brucepastera parasyntrophica]|uniref:diacylglycerol/polyprenol kinase family protein n=1 Tax=Brucepastera parasyntrophica TaxID=2880008 RepID=UPI00210D289F|nr:diacylglycerol/polyprenol kinase family protein [Brucepastera parasyntrophica]ULQ60662.1 SEC59/DGK1/VTE5 family protein [Brucepastera parasyntrophica]
MKGLPMGMFSNFRYRKISQTVTVNDLLKEIFRKSIHFCAAIVPFFAAWNYNWTIFSLSLVICLYIFCESLRLRGISIPFISRITAFAARSRDQGRFVLGPVTLALGVLFALILYPPEIAKVGIYTLAFGDGIASLAGRLLGKTKIPFTRGKTVEGSIACFTAVYISSFLVLYNPFYSLLIAFLAMLIEMLPLKDYDNLVIPLVICSFVCLLP